ncbi:hypothetical protein NADFUDRAFT_39297 [Nadsonia fulvescens var. elongata DSM 6958]|uniref:HECT-type E3 ubiquitin transferase n=1 Tax=Nadsonia fulvescens var. elongata DSM 6958 TaxID=857566 RepID=A0A1E3PR22_9ASCO|nr:hypothetical protein NADFUDRAFT_39297 [Nadsonia fulvescens var. elongata DSM 6958]
MPGWPITSIFKSSKSKKKLESANCNRLVSDNESASRLSGSGLQSSAASVPRVSTHSSEVDIFKLVSAANTSKSSDNNSELSDSFSDPEENYSHGSKDSQQCMCCGTYVKVPRNVSLFRCIVCDTYYDLKVPDLMLKPPKPLTLHYTKHIVKQCYEQQSKKLGDASVNPYFYDIESFQKLENILNYAFSHFEVLNKSFPETCAKYPEPSSNNEKRNTKLSYSSSRINYNDIREFFCLISSLASARPMTIILTAVCNVLKRPRYDIFRAASQLRFLLIILEIPALYQVTSSSSVADSDISRSMRNLSYSILTRVIGLLAHCGENNSRYLLNWFVRLPKDGFENKVNLLTSFIANRLTAHYYNSSQNTMSQSERYQCFGGCGNTENSTGPSRLSSSTTPMANHGSSRIGQVRSSSSREAGPRLPSIYKAKKIKIEDYGSDWKIAAGAKVLAIFFNANIDNPKIPVSQFYNTMVDYTDVYSDFDFWQKMMPIKIHGICRSNSSREDETTARAVAAYISSAADICNSTLDGSLNTSNNGKEDEDFYSSVASPTFAFCQFPFLLSMGAKTLILEYEARRRMESNAREAFFDSIDQKRIVPIYYIIKVHRMSILKDSFESFEKNEENYKKGLRIIFDGEPGIDAGGLRKEWFLLLMKEIFNQSGLFEFDEESKYYWFKLLPSKNIDRQTLKTYKYAGVALGLALYNSIILDLDLPPVIFKLLVGSKYDLQDFQALKPSYGRSLGQILAYDETDIANGGISFEDMFDLNFSITVKNSQGGFSDEPLIHNGLNVAVTALNRQEYVNRVIGYYFNTAIKQPLSAFKIGFYNVVGGNSLTLFRPEELSLLISGSDEEGVDVTALKSVTVYQGWYKVKDQKDYCALEKIPTIKWFWEFFLELSSGEQKKLLRFITGSDRVPATGIINQSFRLTRLGSDCERFPVSHTCFNQLGIYEYSTRAKLRKKLTMAMHESEGFGIK